MTCPARQGSRGSFAAGRSGPQFARRRRGPDANVTKREVLGPRSRSHAVNVTKREVFSAGTEPREGCLQQKPRIRVGGGARGPLHPGSGIEKLRVLLHLHQSGAAGAQNLRVLLHLQQSGNHTISQDSNDLQQFAYIDMYMQINEYLFLCNLFNPSGARDAEKRRCLRVSRMLCTRRGLGNRLPGPRRAHPVAGCTLAPALLLIPAPPTP